MIAAAVAGRDALSDEGPGSGVGDDAYVGDDSQRALGRGRRRG